MMFEKINGKKFTLLPKTPKENKVLCDPCSGSGSHLYVAKELNRRFCGVELDEEYFKVNKDRLNNNVTK